MKETSAEKLTRLMCQTANYLKANIKQLDDDMLFWSKKNPAVKYPLTCRTLVRVNRLCRSTLEPKEVKTPVITYAFHPFVDNASFFHDIFTAKNCTVRQFNKSIIISISLDISLFISNDFVFTTGKRDQ